MRIMIKSKDWHDGRSKNLEGQELTEESSLSGPSINFPTLVKYFNSNFVLFYEFTAVFLNNQLYWHFFIPFWF